MKKRLLNFAEVFRYDFINQLENRVFTQLFKDYNGKFRWIEMRMALFIAFRYLRKRKRQNLLLLLAVVFGVTSFLAGSAIIGGWSDVVVGKTIDVSIGHIVVFPSSGKVYLENYTEIISKIKSLNSVEALSPRLEVESMIIYGEKVKALLVTGLEPETISKVLTIGENVVEGRFLKRGDRGVVVLGDSLADELNVSLNSKIEVVSPTGERIEVTVIGILDTGLHEIDTAAFYVVLDDAKSLLKKDVISNIIIRTNDYNRASTIAEELREKYGLNAKSWEELARPILEAIKVEGLYMNIISLLILMVSALGILNVLYMTVAEKTRDIGILKALGLDDRQIMLIFLINGFIVALIGAIIGCVSGTLVAWHFSTIELPEEVYGVDRIPAHLDPIFYFYSFVLALATAVSASLFPARRAAKLKPVEALRYVL